MDVLEVLGAIGGAIPGVKPVAKGIARQTVQRLIGFWFLWHLYGAGEDIQRLVRGDLMSQASAYRQKVEFYSCFGVPVEDFLPDLAKMIRAYQAIADQALQEGE